MLESVEKHEGAFEIDVQFEDGVEISLSEWLCDFSLLTCPLFLYLCDDR
jgi:hypothetical protein